VEHGTSLAAASVRAYWHIRQSRSSRNRSIMRDVQYAFLNQLAVA